MISTNGVSKFRGVYAGAGQTGESDDKSASLNCEIPFSPGRMLCALDDPGEHV